MSSCCSHWASFIENSSSSTVPTMQPQAEYRDRHASIQHGSCYAEDVRHPSTADAAINLVVGTVTKYIVLALNIGLGIVLMPFTVRHLGQTAYGLWMLVASMTTYFQLLDLGYGNGLVRHLVAADRRGDTEQV